MKNKLKNRLGKMIFALFLQKVMPLLLLCMFSQSAVAQTLTVNGELHVNGKGRIGVGARFPNTAHALAFGYNAKVESNNSVALGREAQILSDAVNAIAIGAYAKVGSVSTGAMALGNGAYAEGIRVMAIGPFNESVSDAAFIFGNGTSDLTRSNAIVIKNNGDTGVGTNDPEAKLHVEGPTKLKGDVTVVDAKIRVSPSGDLGMGSFTAGTAPE